MALIGKKTAVVSLGISCQTTFQIEYAKASLSRETGEDFEIVRMPFDWRIGAPTDVAACLRENNPYPQSGAELSRDRHRYWERRRTWFWHDKWDDFAKFSSKQAHLWANWGKIAGTRRQVFVVSNTQNDLWNKLDTHGGFDIRVRMPALFELHAVLTSLFPAPELHFVTRPPLMKDLEAYGMTSKQVGPHHKGLTRLSKDGVFLHIIEPDRSSWQGNGGDWGKILDRVIRRKVS